MVKADGTTFWVRLEANITQDPSVCRIVLSDISERKAAEIALHESEERLLTIMNNADASIYIADMHTYELLFANEKIRKAWGGFDLIGQPCWQALYGLQEPCPYCNNAKLLSAHGNVVNWEFQNLLNGKWYDCRDSTIRWTDGRLVRMEMATDISENKKMDEEHKQWERQQQQMQKVESLRRMAGAIAHHFNNQLAVVMGTLEMALPDLAQGEQLHKYISAALNATQKAVEVSSLMLTYLGQSFEKRAAIDLFDTWRRSLPILQATIASNVKLECDLPTRGPIIMANTNQIQQVLSNLFTNAWEAIGEQRGSIHLSARTLTQLEISAENCFPIGWQAQDNGYACLEVTDTGAGIAQKDIERLFDPFFSTKDTISRGMGLAVVLGIMRAYAGAVTVVSEVGKGSTFRVYLPLSAEEILRQPIEMQYDEMQGDETVLLIEDFEMLRGMAAGMLNQLGYSVIEAADGVEGVEIFRQQQHKIDCVLCDLTMPRMNGWETMTALRKISPDIPMILTSGYDKAQAMSGEHADLTQNFLAKPYKMAELHAAIIQALRGKTPKT